MLTFFLSFADRLRHSARLRSWSSSQASGRRGEDLAHRFLQARGFRIVARNYRCRSGAGEIDLVAWDRETLVFVEVKSRRTEEFGTPDRAVDRDKQSALVRAAREYARRTNTEWQFVRFDVVSVVLSEPPSVSHIPDAFSPRVGL